METKEKNFEQDIESWLLTEGGYVKGNMWTYDKRRAIDMPVLIQFIEATQPKQWERYKNIYGEPDKSKFPVSNLVGEKGLWLPSAGQLTDEEIMIICKKIKAFYQK